MARVDWMEKPLSEVIAVREIYREKYKKLVN